MTTYLHSEIEEDRMKLPKKLDVINRDDHAERFLHAAGVEDTYEIRNKLNEIIDYLSDKEASKGECPECGDKRACFPWCRVDPPQQEESKEKEVEFCKHCGKSISERNPSGFCDHLYYPENCDICRISKNRDKMIEQEESRGERKAQETSEQPLLVCPICKASIDDSEEYYKNGCWMCKSKEPQLKEESLEQEWKCKRCGEKNISYICQNCAEESPKEDEWNERLADILHGVRPDQYIETCKLIRKEFVSKVKIKRASSIKYLGREWVSKIDLGLEEL